LLAIHKAGGGLMLGADAPQIFNPPGFSAHRELSLLVEAGLTPYEALKTGTVNVARYLNETGSAGIIAVGARADLLFLDVNPLETIPFQNHIEGVVSAGVYYDREQLNLLLQEVKNHIE
jgi:imidazolonepropionase-like amidohydrolase